jgi:hypothetical protein
MIYRNIQLAGVVNHKFYVYHNGTMRVSTDGGQTFAAAGTPASGGSSVIRVAPGREGDIWVPLKAAAWRARPIRAHRS